MADGWISVAETFPLIPTFATLAVYTWLFVHLVGLQSGWAYAAALFATSATLAAYLSIGYVIPSR